MASAPTRWELDAVEAINRQTLDELGDPAAVMIGHRLRVILQVVEVDRDLLVEVARVADARFEDIGLWCRGCDDRAATEWS